MTEGQPAVDQPVVDQTRPDRGRQVLAVIALGGVIGAELRYGAGQLLPPGPRSFPWATVLVNVVGGFAIGVLMALLDRKALRGRRALPAGSPARPPHPLIRPFFGVGILGGLTTFSTFSTDTYRLLDAGRPVLALGYAGLTLAAALLATVAGMAAVGALSLGSRRRHEVA